MVDDNVADGSDASFLQCTDQGGQLLLIAVAAVQIVQLTREVSLHGEYVVVTC